MQDLIWRYLLIAIRPVKPIQETMNSHESRFSAERPVPASGDTSVPARSIVSRSNDDKHSAQGA